MTYFETLEHNIKVWGNRLKVLTPSYEELSCDDDLSCKENALAWVVADHWAPVDWNLEWATAKLRAKLVYRRELNAHHCIWKDPEWHHLLPSKKEKVEMVRWLRADRKQLCKIRNKSYELAS